jgi:hypothetical protein
MMASIAGCASTRPGTITKAEARSLPEPVVKRRVMTQLGDLLTGPRGQRRVAPIHPLTDMTFEARPRATVVPGLCRADQLTVTFRARGTGPRNADTPVSADGFRSSSYFYFLTPPTASYDALADHEGVLDDAACRAASRDEPTYFRAEDEEVATNGVLVARRVMDAVAAGEPAFALTCDRFRNEADRQCVDILRQIAVNRVDFVRQCEIDRPETPGAHCYRVEVGDRSLRIVTTPISYGGRAPPPLTILDVHMAGMIILVHERID